MQDIILSLFINGTLATLMLVTILYCRKVNARIRILQDSKSDLARIIREFDESTKRATQSIAEIHEATRRLSDNIQHKIDKANFLADDLQSLIERGNRVLGKTEPTVAAPPRPTPSARATPVAKEAEAKPTDTLGSIGATARRALRMRSRAEQDLRQVLGKEEGN